MVVLVAVAASFLEAEGGEFEIILGIRDARDGTGDEDAVVHGLWNYLWNRLWKKVVMLCE